MKMSRNPQMKTAMGTSATQENLNYNCHQLPWWLGDFPGNSAGKESACNAGDPGSIPGLWRSPGEGNGYPLQYSCLEIVKVIEWGLWEPEIRCKSSWLQNSTSSFRLFVKSFSCSTQVKSWLLPSENQGKLWNSSLRQKYGGRRTLNQKFTGNLHRYMA